MNSIPKEALQLIRHAVTLLVSGEYEQLAQLSKGIRLSAHDFDIAIRGYGQTIVVPPADSLELDPVRILGSEQPGWSVNVPLWSAEEGRSDLTLSLTIWAIPNSPIRIEFDDLRAL